MRPKRILHMRCLGGLKISLEILYIVSFLFIYYLLIYILFNNALSCSDDTVLNNKANNELETIPQKVVAA